jgi:hypothetical protein
MVLLEEDRAPLDPLPNTLGRVEGGMLPEESLPVEVPMQLRVVQLGGSDD